MSDNPEQKDPIMWFLKVILKVVVGLLVLVVVGFGLLVGFCAILGGR